ncbi:MAG: hypothetical protein AAF218_10420 [Pseudomonadota bacterium]
MGDIDEMQRRLSAAMDRVARALEAAPSNTGAETAALTAELEEERLANAQLQERVTALKSRADLAVTLEERFAALDADLQRLRAANDGLRRSNETLRAANADGLADAEAINSGLQAELTALRAQHAADRSEGAAILAAMTAVLTETGENASDA